MTQETITLTVEPREVTGKAVKHLRKAGKIPAVIHDHGKDSVIVQGDAVAMTKVFHRAGKHHAVELNANGKTYTTLIKGVTVEPKKNTLSHVVFNAVNRNEKVEAEVPIHAQYDEGNDASPAERAGLMVISNIDVVLVEATATNLPDVLYYDAEKLVEVGNHVTVADLLVPQGVTVKTEAEHTIATVFEPSAVAAANDALSGGETTEAGETTGEAEAVNETPAEETAE